MTPFTRLTALAAPLDMANVDTDQIIPARFLHKPRGPDFGELAFRDLRFDAEGREKPGFVLNQAPYRGAKILVAGANFGCGSSREAAVYVLWDLGIRAVIASSFGEIHYGNELQNGMLPVVLPEETCRRLREKLHGRPGAQLTVDLEAQQVVDPDGAAHRFEIDPAQRERLLKGLDEVGLILQHLGEIEQHEARQRAEMPWLA